jgi:TRAP-type C4-dicarboxylate transport system substrate-binding protein
MGKDSIAPRIGPELYSQLNDSGLFDVNYVPEGQLCGEAACTTKVASGTIQAANSSVGNSTAYYPTNGVWIVPYMFPSYAAQFHTFFHADTWERYWVAHAKEYGAIPIACNPPRFRQLMIGTDRVDQAGDTRFTTPSDIEGLSIRRTKARAPQVAMNQWGANGVDLAWGDTIQGLKTGVVDGLESFYMDALTFGMGPSIGQTIKNDWSGFSEFIVANVDWLKGLSNEQRSKLADVTKSVTEEYAPLAPKIDERVGYSDPPPSGSASDEFGITMNVLDDDEKQKWMDPVRPDENADLYSDIIADMDSIGVKGGGEDFFNFLVEESRSSNVPGSIGDWSADAWWDDYIDQI